MKDGNSPYSDAWRLFDDHSLERDVALHPRGRNRTAAATTTSSQDGTKESEAWQLFDDQALEQDAVLHAHTNNRNVPSMASVRDLTVVLVSPPVTTVPWQGPDPTCLDTGAIVGPRRGRPSHSGHE